MPSYSDLKTKFDYVSDIFKDDVKWEYSVPREEIDLDRMQLVHFNRLLSSEEAIKEMDDKGYRPATHEELIAWAEKNPEEQRKYPIIAFGSSALDGDLRFFALVWSNGGRRLLDRSWFDGGFCAWYRVLFVRKSSSSPLTLEPSALSDGTLSLGLFIKATEAFLEVLRGGVEK